MFFSCKKYHKDFRSVALLSDPASINESPNYSTEERSNPIHKMMMPDSESKRRPKRTSWIHRCAGYGTTRKHGQSNGKTDKQTTHLRTSGIHCSPEDDEEQEKCQNEFNKDSSGNHCSS